MVSAAGAVSSAKTHTPPRDLTGIDYCVPIKPDRRTLKFPSFQAGRRPRRGLKMVPGGTAGRLWARRYSPASASRSGPIGPHTMCRCCRSRAWRAAACQGRSSAIGPSTVNTPRSWSVTIRKNGWDLDIERHSTTILQYPSALDLIRWIIRCAGGRQTARQIKYAPLAQVCAIGVGRSQCGRVAFAIADRGFG